MGNNTSVPEADDSFTTRPSTRDVLRTAWRNDRNPSHAIVSRMDLARFPNEVAGRRFRWVKGVFIYEVLEPNGRPFTLIFEYALPWKVR
jgi:hypothetical protein